MITRYIRPAGCLIILMTLLLGVIYPVVIRAVGSALFPFKAGGSLIYAGKTLNGSRLIGQKFSDSKYFWGRPSATSPQPYNGLASGGSNLGPLNPTLLNTVKANVKTLHETDPGNERPIPVELVAQLCHLPLSIIQSLIRQRETGPVLGIIGEPTVNVPESNFALDLLH